MMLAVAALLTTGAVFACDGKKDCTKCKKEEKKACGKDCKKDCKNARKTLKLQLYKFVFINKRFQKSR